MTNAYEHSGITNSYGLLKAPWNNDPTPFLTRSDKVYGYTNNLKPSGCAEYSAAVNQNTWMALSRQLNAAAHGHIHELLGGSWNHGFGQKYNFEEFDAAFTVAHEIQALSKELWRNDFISCPNYCAPDTPWTECMCSCSNSQLLQQETSAIEVAS